MAANWIGDAVGNELASQTGPANLPCVMPTQCPGFIVLGSADHQKRAKKPRTHIRFRSLLRASPRLSSPQQQLPQPNVTYPLNELARALSVHPRTILRMTTGLPNPYWVDGHNPDLDTAMLALILGSSPVSIASLVENEDAALDAGQAARLLRCKRVQFYRKSLCADWQIGRVKRYSLLRLVGEKQKHLRPAARK